MTEYRSISDYIKECEEKVEIMIEQHHLEVTDLKRRLKVAEMALARLDNAGMFETIDIEKHLSMYEVISGTTLMLREEQREMWERANKAKLQAVEALKQIRE